MALFRCASGSSGGGATITVTYSSDFYGETVTCSHGTKTYSKVATSSGTLEFSVDEEGTWTISCTIGGDTFTTTADVDLTYDAELVSLPNGETVLPTDDIETWLACAGITDKAYTTLSQVLGDSETYNALLGDSNACAYMKRSTTWAIRSGLVPVMTSATTPSGTVISDSDYSGQNNWKAFDGDSSTNWNSNKYSASSGEYYCGYLFTETKNVTRIKGILGKSSNVSTVTCKFQYYSNNTWVDIPDSTITVNSSPMTIDLVVDTVSADGIRLYGQSTQENGVTAIFELQFYTDADITTNQYAMNLLGQYDTACDALLSDATWASAIANSTYADSVISGMIPIMTSNTTPSGVASASSKYASNDAYYAMNDNSSNQWVSADNQGVNSWLKYEFPTAQKIVGFRVKSGSDASHKAISGYIIQGSNDDFVSDINDLYTGSNSNQTFDITASFDNDTAYKYYRLYITSILDSSNAYCAVFQLYGRKSSSEKIHGGNPTYDSFYRIVDGNNVPVTDPSLLDVGTYTIYSNGLAKDPSDLSADYGKTIRICPNTKEILVRPDISLYWCGNLCESITGGIETTLQTWDAYSRSGVSKFSAPILNDTTFESTPYNTANAYASGYSYHNDITLEAGDVLHVILEEVTGSTDSTRGSLNNFGVGTFTLKSYGGENNSLVDYQYVPNTSVPVHVTLTGTGKGYISVARLWYPNIKCSAIWIERA